MKANKGRRQELTRLKFKKRLKQLGLLGQDGKFFAYKSHGKPCSCSICRNLKYNRAKSNQSIEKQIYYA